MSAIGGARLRRALPTAPLALVALVGSLLCLGQVGQGPVREAVASSAQTATALIAALCCRHARALDASTRRAWTWAMRASAAWAGGNVALLASNALGHPGRPNLGDPLYLAASVCAVVAAMSFPSAPELTSSRVRLLTDGAIAAGGLLFTTWLLLLTLLPASTGSVEVLQAGYPLVDIVILCALVTAVLRLPSSQRAPLATVCVGVGLLATSTLLTFVLDSRGSFHPGDRAELVAVLALALVAVGASLQRPADRPRAVSPAAGRVQLLVPYASVLSALITGVAAFDHINRGLLITAVATALLVIARQVLLVLENSALVEQLALDARRVEAIIDGSHDLTLLVDAQGVVRWASPSTGPLSASLGSVEGRALGELLGTPQAAATGLRAALSSGLATYDAFWLDADGTRHEFELVLTDRTNDPLLRAVLVQARDVTARRRAESALAESEERHRRIVEAASDGIWLLNTDLQVQYVNERGAAITGLTPDQLRGQHVLDAIAHHLTAEQRSEFGARLAERLAGQAGEYEMTLQRDDQHMRLQISGAPLVGADGTVEGVVTTISDITVRSQLEADLLRQATTDSLTGLLNREHFLASATDVLGRPGGAAVLFCDLDGFKEVNDTYGHSVGDELLRIVAHRVSRCLGGSDVLARLGGDEFAAVLVDLADEGGALAVAERMLEVIRRPVRVSGRTLHVSGSIGITLAAADKDVEQLLREADLAMYQAKSAGRGCSRVFAPSMHAALLHRMAIDLELRDALSREEFELVYQPVIALADGTVPGLEALVRWRHPTRGLVRPDEFIPACEESGLIVELGHWVLEQSCAQIAAWSGIGLDVNVGVNVASQQLEDGRFAEQVGAALARHGIPAERLILEITERALLAGDSTRQCIAELDALGVALALDDFGTGNSSLAHLREFPVDIVKIDKSYIHRLTTDPREAQLVHGLVDLVRRLGLDVVAEGIETAEQEAAVRRLGAAYGQGFRYAPGMPPAEATAWLRTPRLRLSVPSPRSAGDVPAASTSP